MQFKVMGLRDHVTLNLKSNTLEAAVFLSFQEAFDTQSLYMLS